MIKINSRHFFVKTLAFIVLMTVFATAPITAGQPQGHKPVIVKTLWGQKIVPDLMTYIAMMKYSRLHPGQSWKEGKGISKEILEKYSNGELKLRVHPWRVVDGVFVLGRYDRAQLIYLLDTGQGLLLIDPSFDSWHELILAQIEELGYDPSQVKWVLIATSTTPNPVSSGAKGELRSSPLRKMLTLSKPETKSRPGGW
jgi:hypothetical protein